MKRSRRKVVDTQGDNFAVTILQAPDQGRSSVTGHMANYVSVASSRSMSITAVAIKFPKHRDSAGQYFPLWDFHCVNRLCRGSVKDSVVAILAVSNCVQTQPFPAAARAARLADHATGPRVESVRHWIWGISANRGP